VEANASWKKLKESKNVENWGNTFWWQISYKRITECDNSAYNSSKTNFWLALLADYL